MKTQEKQATVLEALRRSKGWTQAELATKSGVDQSTISRLERLQVGMGPRRARKLAEPLGVDPADLRIFQIAQTITRFADELSFPQRMELATELAKVAEELDEGSNGRQIAQELIEKPTFPAYTPGDWPGSPATTFGRDVFGRKVPDTTASKKSGRTEKVAVGRDAFGKKFDKQAGR